MLRDSATTGWGVFGWLFTGLLRALRAVNWPRPAA